MLREDNRFYFCKYIPYPVWEDFTDDGVQLSKIILDYKEGKTDAIKYFSSRLKSLLKSRDWNLGLDDCIFVPVPCSKARHNIPITYNNDPERGCKLLNEAASGISNFYFAELLFRKYSIDESHSKDKNLTMLDQYKSLGAIKFKLPTKIIVLFDDVYTRGRTFNACCKILKENGYKDKIYGVILGKTIEAGEVLQNKIEKSKY